jgi:hypothetical protein
MSCWKYLVEVKKKKGEEKKLLSKGICRHGYSSAFLKNLQCPRKAYRMKHRYFSQRRGGNIQRWQLRRVAEATTGASESICYDGRSPK